MKPVAVGDGPAALDALEHAGHRGQPHALVLLDARMPDMDGLDLADRIRKRAEWSDARIILLTSGDRPGRPKSGDLPRSRELRIDAQLRKPVQQEELLETIYRVMSPLVSGRLVSGEWFGGSAGSSPLTTHRSPLTPHLRILVAEDNEFNAQLLEQLLVRRGHRVRLANNGRDALALLGIRSQETVDRDQESGVRDQASGVKNQPAGANSSLTPDPCLLTPDFDLLLLDVHMPELDGFQVVQAVRDHERAAGGHLPVIALTARARREDRERCLAAGMDDFLAKPIQAANLWATIDRIVERRGTRIEVREQESGIRSRESGVTDRESGDRSQEAGANSSLTPDSCILTPALVHPPTSILDPRALLAACGGDAIILEKICQVFRASLPDHWTAVQDALEERDSPRLREAAHKLCGMVAAFSAGAGQAASELEDCAAQGLLEEARPLVRRLEEMVRELLHVVVGLSLDSLREQQATAAVGQ
jgi:CheY-like chemotaxis protein